jgi:hypothetical protein
MGKSKLDAHCHLLPRWATGGCHDYRLWFVRIDDGKKMPTKIQAESIVFSPDGRWMLAAQRQSMNIYDANGHLVRQIQSISPIAFGLQPSPKTGNALPVFGGHSKEIADPSHAAVWRLRLANRWLAFDAVNAFDAVLRNLC